MTVVRTPLQGPGRPHARADAGAYYALCLLHCQARCRLLLIGLPGMYEVALIRFEVVVVGRGRCLKCATVVCAPLQGPAQ